MTPEGAVLAAFLDSLNVSSHWLNDEHVAWFSGLANNPDAAYGVATHCSAFAAAVAERLGIYILRPPEHSQVGGVGGRRMWLVALPPVDRCKPTLPAAASSPWLQVLLANQQHDWVGSEGVAQGWRALPGPVEAQALANRGHLVLYLRRNSIASKPGELPA